MKSIKVSELKANLSRYLRMASRGARIVVTDREEPVAQLGPLEGEPTSWRERLARDGRLRLGTQDWRTLRIATLPHTVDIQAALQAVREEPGEVHRR
jgi:prevent-host-death family protein